MFLAKKLLPVEENWSTHLLRYHYVLLNNNEIIIIFMCIIINNQFLSLIKTLLFNDVTS